MAQVRVIGLPRFLRTLRQAGVEIEDQREAMTRVAAMVATGISSAAPRRAGRLSASVRGSKSKGRASVRVGTTARTRLYVGPIHYGWPGHGIEPNPFAERTLQRLEPTIAAELERQLQAALDKVKGA
jgi:hypothetical protein